MWKVVHIAQKSEQAQTIRSLLQKENFLVDIKEGGSSCFEVRVAASEAEEATELLCNYRCSSKFCG